jgi:hypothetical protein
MDNFWKDKNGRIVIIQKPNLLLISWFVSFLITKLPISAPALNLFSAFSFGAIFVWAWLEIFSGVNIFRKLLGLAVMIYMLVGSFK